MSETHVEGSTAIAEHGKHPNYVGVFIFLAVLTAIEIGVSTYFVRSAAKVPMLLILAAAKGFLVALYYMHLRFDSRIFSFFFSAAIFVLAVPFALVVMTTLAAPTGADKTQPNPNPTPINVTTGNSTTPVPNAQNNGAKQGGTTLTVTAKEKGCAPPAVFCWEQMQLNLSVGQNATVVVKNPAGNSSPHSFALKNVAGAQVAEVPAGKDGSGSFQAPAAGSYTFICAVPGHEQLGMTGTLTVQ